MKLFWFSNSPCHFYFTNSKVGVITFPIEYIDKNSVNIILQNNRPIAKNTPIQTHNNLSKLWYEQVIFANC